MDKNVLIIDDDPMIRNLVKGILENEGYLINMAEDGQKGIEHISAEPRPVKYQLIILDVVMPGMNGLEVLSKLKENNETNKIPVLMLTGEAKAEDIMAGYSSGADYYITKPFTRQQLLYGLNLVLNKEA